MPQPKIKTRLLDIEHERARLIEQLGSMELDLSSGLRYIDSNLQLLENPQQLYRGASDEVRRRLNQAIFTALHIEDEKVIRDALNEPLDELFATEAGYRTGTIDPGSEAINAAYTAASAAAQPTNNKATQTGGLIPQQHATTTWAELITAFYSDGGSYKPPMVDILRRYLNQEQAEIAVLTLISDARRSQIPQGKITPRTLQARAIRLSNEQIEELIACYLAGDSTYALSRRFDIRRETVVAHLERRGITRRHSTEIITG